jgi:hypothetical protein
MVVSEKRLEMEINRFFYVLIMIGFFFLSFGVLFLLIPLNSTMTLFNHYFFAVVFIFSSIIIHIPSIYYFVFCRPMKKKRYHLSSLFWLFWIFFMMGMTSFSLVILSNIPDMNSPTSAQNANAFFYGCGGTGFTIYGTIVLYKWLKPKSEKKQKLSAHMFASALISGLTLSMGSIGYYFLSIKVSQGEPDFNAYLGIIMLVGCCLIEGVLFLILALQNRGVLNRLR